MRTCYYTNSHSEADYEILRYAQNDVQPKNLITKIQTLQEAR